MPASEPSLSQIEATLKRAVAALDGARVPHMLGGSLASWARGGPPTRHDLDLIVTPDDAARGLAALAEAGMRTERPPEGWLFKGWDDDVLVDLIFEPRGLEVTDEMIEAAERREFLGMSVRVMSLQDLMVTKLLSIDEQRLRYEGVLRIARAVREQVDWDEVRARTSESPFARAFFVMGEGLGVIKPPEAVSPEGTRITVRPGLSALEGGSGRGA
jgi:nucleotidyltransferase DUF2204